MTRPLLSRLARPELPDPESEAILTAAEHEIARFLRTQGLDENAVRQFVVRLNFPELRHHIATVVELSPTR